MSDEVIKPPTSSNNSNILSPDISYVVTKTRVEFYGSCLKQDTIIYTHRTLVNIYIVYEITKNDPLSSHPTLENCLFGEVKLTKNPDIDKYKYTGYGIGFNSKGKFSFGNGFAQNVIIFGVDVSSSDHTNKKKRIF